MATLIASNSVPSALCLNKTIAASSPPLHFSSPVVRFPGGLCRRNKRRLVMITRAGPSTSSLVFAFVFPLSLVAITIFTSIRIADKLDKDFLEEMNQLALNQAMKEGEDEGEDSPISVEEEPALPRSRNRPKREA